MPDLPLSTAELVQMRHTLETYLPGTAVVHAATKTADAQGGYEWVYAASSTVDARIAPDSGSEEAVGGRLAEVQQYTLTVPNTTTIDEDDRVVYNSETYEVVAVLNHVPWDLDRRVRVVRVD